MRDISFAVLMGVVATCIVVGFVIALLLTVTSPAGATEPSSGTFYQYVDPASGALAFTDDPKQVPEAARSAVVQRNLEELRAATASQVTPSGPTVGPYVYDYQPPVPRQQPECSGSVTVIQERRQVGDYSRNFYVAYDECGREIFTSTVPVRPEVKR